MKIPANPRPLSKESWGGGWGLPDLVPQVDCDTAVQQLHSVVGLGSWGSKRRKGDVCGLCGESRTLILV